MSLAGACRVAVLAIALAASGCDQSALTPTPPAACTEIGARCQLPDGPLGVCEQRPCPPGTAPPCFTCIPQH